MKGSIITSAHPVVKAFVAKLDGLEREGFPAAGIDAAFAAHPFGPEVCDPYTFFFEKRYTRNLIHKASGYELLLLCWMPGQESAVHGHEGEKCWMRVEQGQLHFINYEEVVVDGATRIICRGEAVGGPGFVDGPAIIHSVHNKSKDQPALSLHLYARPFAQCDIFDVEAQERRRVNLSYDSMYGQLVTGAAV